MPVTIALLQARRSYPSVSLILSTPDGTVSAADVDRGLRHIDELDRRLRGDCTDRLRDEIVDSLRVQLRSHAGAANGGGLALFASNGFEAAMPLAVEVRERSVVDATFATRDLVDHVRRAVSFTVVAVSDNRVRLLHGTHALLTEVASEPFPLVRGDDESIASWTRRAVSALRLHGASTDHPLVVAGVERQVVDLLDRSGVTPLAIVKGNHDRTSRAELHRLAWVEVEGWLKERESEAVERLDRARSRKLYVSGIDELWTLAAEGRVAHLVAERGFEYPARLNGDALVPVGDDEVTAPDVIDDAVDELIEAVVNQRGTVVLVADGTLADAGRIAAELRW
jgi:hypothetical protein